MSPDVAAVAEAYVWGLPLVTMHRTCAVHGGVGRGMVARDGLATAADRTVVAPNNDTLYASGWFDLRAGDLVVGVGAMDTPTRYWSVMLLDAYTDVTYVCRRLHGSSGTRVRVTCDPAARPPPNDLPVRPPATPADAVPGPPGPPPAPADVQDSPPPAVSADGPGNADAGGASPLGGVLADGPRGAGAAGAGRASSPEGPLVGGAEDAVASDVGPTSSPGGVLADRPRGAAGAGGTSSLGGVLVDSRGNAGALDAGRSLVPDGVFAGGSGRPAGRAGGLVGVGTPTVWVLARVLVAGPDDLGAARDALARIRVEQVGGRRMDGQAAAGGAGAARRGRRSGDGGGFLDELRAALAVDPPGAKHPAPPEGLEELLRTPPAPEVVAAGLERGRMLVARSGGVDRWGNGWGTRSRGARFGGDIAYRAAFARVSLAGHHPAENRSYTRPFDGSTPARLRFPPGGEPPVDGFWSLCVYGPDLFLVDNAIDRYSVGDRTPGLRRDPDGGLTITIGADRADRPDGSVAGVGNWLPAPAGPCFLTLRAYEGRAAVVDATWFPPDLESLS